MPERRSHVFAAKVESAPDNVLFRFSLAQALFDEGEYAAAIPHLRRAVESRTDWMLARIVLGKCLLQSGDLPSARSEFEAALSLARAQNHEGPESELLSLLADLNPKK